MQSRAPETSLAQQAVVDAERRGCGLPAVVFGPPPAFRGDWHGLDFSGAGPTRRPEQLRKAKRLRNVILPPWQDWYTIGARRVVLQRILTDAPVPDPAG